MLNIRVARQDDVKAVLPLVQEFAASVPIEEKAYTQTLTHLLDAVNTLLLVAENYESLIGYSLGFCHPTFSVNGKAAWLEKIMVHRTHRRQGAARALMNDFEGWARTEGCVLSALATRRAAPFYLALGYEDSANYFRKIL